MKFGKYTKKEEPPKPEYRWLTQRQWVQKTYTRWSEPVFMCPVTGDIYSVEDAVKAQITREVKHA